MTLRRVPVVTALLLGVAAAPASAQQVTLEGLLVHASEYVARYFSVVPGLVAEEDYRQDLVSVQPMAARMPDSLVPPPLNKRQHSEVVLIDIGPPLQWRVYRDVFEVDGTPVRDRDERLAKLILQPTTTAREQAERIAEESARFNISNVGRVLNEPGLPLVFLQAALRPKFRFTLDRRDGDAWILRYEERARPTLFRHNYTQNNPSSGRFWIRPATGEVTRAEHIVKPPGLTATFTTIFEYDERFGVAVPTEMRETLTISGRTAADARRLDGTAKYSNYRRFTVETHEGTRVP